MRFFKPKLNICDECQLAFRPVEGYEARWNNLCSQHRKRFVDEALRIDRLLDWARRNPSAVEKAMEATLQAEFEAQKEKFNIRRAYMEGMQNAV